MKLAKGLVLAFGVLFLSQSLADSAPQMYVESSMYGHSETAPVAQIVVDDFEGEVFEGGTFSYTHNVWEAGARYAAYKIAAIARYDYLLEYTEDVAELIYADKNNLPIETHRDYRLYLAARHARTYGVKLGYTYEATPQMAFSMDLSMLNVASFIDGQVSGDVRVDADSYSGEIDLDYVYNKDKLLDRIADKPSGYGYALDLAWVWQAHPRLRFAAALHDVLSALRIDRAPFTRASARSNRVSLGADDRIDVKPTLTGQENYRAHTLRLPQRVNLQGHYALTEDYGLGLQLQTLRSRRYVSVLLERRIDAVQSLHTAFDGRKKAVTLEWRAAHWHAAITSDHLNVEKARTFGLALGVSQAF